VIGARRHGLIANLSRFLRWRPATAAEESAATRLREVEAAFLDATVPGARVGDVFRAGADAFSRFGFDEFEWRRHHQGGPAGYQGRDPKATTTTDDVVQNNHAFAWNPTAPGQKTEDTVLASDDGIEILTIDERWPTVMQSGRARPLELAL
jgi:Xaa-Pro aminopeptidase